MIQMCCGDCFRCHVVDKDHNLYGSKGVMLNVKPACASR